MDDCVTVLPASSDKGGKRQNLTEEEDADSPLPACNLLTHLSNRHKRRRAMFALVRLGFPSPDPQTGHNCLGYVRRSLLSQDRVPLFLQPFPATRVPCKACPELGAPPFRAEANNNIGGYEMLLYPGHWRIIWLYGFHQHYASQADAEVTIFIRDFPPVLVLLTHYPSKPYL